MSTSAAQSERNFSFKAAPWNKMSELEAAKRLQTACILKCLQYFLNNSSTYFLNSESSFTLLEFWKCPQYFLPSTKTSTCSLLTFIINLNYSFTSVTTLGFLWLFYVSQIQKLILVNSAQYHRFDICYLKIFNTGLNISASMTIRHFSDFGV